jgi:hypothetical protein
VVEQRITSKLTPVVLDLNSSAKILQLDTSRTERIPKHKTPEEEYFRLTVLALKMLHHEHRLASQDSPLVAGWVNEMNTKTLYQ